MIENLAQKLDHEDLDHKDWKRNIRLLITLQEINTAKKQFTRW